MNFKPNKATV